MANVVVGALDLNVYGGPASIDVAIDFGRQGTRGSKFWLGQGDPTSALSGQDVLVNDLYINTLPTDPYYGWLYQYVIEVGSLVWTKVFSINPTQYTTKKVQTFASGSTTVLIPISQFTTGTVSLLSTFTITYTIEGTNPIATSFTPSIVGTDLSIVIKAIEYSGGSWSNLSGTKNVNMLVSYRAAG